MFQPKGGYEGYGGYGVRKVADAILGRNKAPTGSPERYRDISDALLAQGTSTAPVGHWTQGAARVAQALVGREMANKASTLEERQKAFAQAQQVMQNKEADQRREDIRGRLSPEQQIAFDLDPEAFGKAVASQYEPMNLTEGSTRYVQGQEPFKNQKTFTPTDPAKLAIDQQNADANTYRAHNPSPAVTVNTGDAGGAPTAISQIPNGQVVPTELLGGYKPDSGFMAVRNNEAQGGFELVPFEGGKFDRANENRELRAGRTGGTVVQDINRALELESQEGLAGEMAVGPLAGLTKIIPGTPADRVDNLVQSALSNIGIDQLQAMRDASPTGGALGQVPVQQQMRLEQMLGNLQVQQVDEDWRNNAKRAVNIYLDIIHGPGKGPARSDLNFDYMGRPLEARPDGVSTDEWFNMDPEERALFQ